jgi:hypothetical protein
VIVHIGNLPAALSEAGLRRLVRAPQALAVQLIHKQDRHGCAYRYALLHARSAREGAKLIRRVNGVTCMGRRLVAREFSQRLSGNERRRLDWRTVPWTGMERRLGERRVSG